jgi:hypothetical protein
MELIMILSMAVSLMGSRYYDCNNIPPLHTAPLHCVDEWLGGEPPDSEWYEVAFCESRYMTGAFGDGSLGGSYGLYQIHRPVHENAINSIGLTFDDMYDPVSNIEFARTLYNQYGDWTHWSCKPTGDMTWRCSDDNPRNADGTNDLWHYINNSEEACRTTENNKQ